MCNLLFITMSHVTMENFLAVAVNNAIVQKILVCGILKIFPLKDTGDRVVAKSLLVGTHLI